MTFEEKIRNEEKSSEKVIRGISPLYYIQYGHITEDDLIKDKQKWVSVERTIEIYAEDQKKVLSWYKTKIETLKRDLRISVDSHNEDLAKEKESKQELQQLLAKNTCKQCSIYLESGCPLENKIREEEKKEVLVQ